jgi:UDP-glucose 4-epimerase
MAYLVTGGAGFIGSRVVRDLVRDGEQVVVYDWFPETDNLKRVLDKEEIEASVKIVHGDVTDYSHLLCTIKGNNVGRIIHMAAMMLLEVNASPLRGVRVNCEGTVAVFEAARFLGLEKVVWPSSGSVYGPPERYNEEYIPNDAPHFPQNIYGAAKSFDEFVAGYYSDRYNMDITALRLVMVYGVGQKRGRTARIIRELICNPAIGKPGKVPAAGDNVLGWTYVDDAAAVIVLAARTSHPANKAYSVRGDIHTVQEIAGFVTELVPDADIKLLPLEKSASHTIMTCKYDMSLVEKELGYRPRWSMRQGIREVMDTVRRENGMSPLP